MGPRSGRGRIFLACIVLFVDLIGAHTNARAGCEVTSVIGADPSLANSEAVVWIGRSWNQVFTATDTLVKSLTVWRPARNDSMYFPIKLYVLEVDSSFGLQRPNPKGIVLDAPDIVVPGSGGIDPIKVQWVFDPPLALPHRGQFAFQVKEDLCGGSFALLSSSNDVYAGGDVWRTDPNVGCVGAGCCPTQYSYARDLVFSIEFCDSPVATGSQTWGRVKSIFR
ncbi:MAG: hypothetical protein C5B54_11235 [Acidobacteria bacterium]|nr:MAG: hypothetical protein C5B54_11235 [Acidobacteriota bacterium]